MTRRDLITLLGGAAVAPAMLWPHAARAQQRADRMRRIGALMLARDPSGRAPIEAFGKAVQERGWME